MQAYREVIEPETVERDKRRDAQAFYCSECNTIKIGAPIGPKRVYDLHKIFEDRYNNPEFLPVEGTEIPIVTRWMCWINPEASDEVCFLEEDTFEYGTVEQLMENHEYADVYDEDGEAFDWEDQLNEESQINWICGECEKKFSVRNYGEDMAELHAVRCCRIIT